MRHKVSHLFKKIAFKFAIFGVSAVVFNFTVVLESIRPSLLVFTQRETETEKVWEASSRLPAGNYYLSVGRAQGSCQLLLDGVRIDGNEGMEGISRSNLFIGAKIILSKSTNTKIELICEKEDGIIVRLIHRPYIHYYRFSVFLHLFRVVTDQFIPCLALVVIILYLAFATQGRKKYVSLNAIAASTFSGLYITSLCNIYYIFMDSQSALFFHSVLKVNFVFFLLSWICNEPKTSKALKAASFITVSLLFLGFKVDQSVFLFSYKAFVYFVPLLGPISILLVRSKRKDVDDLVPIILPISFFSVLDCFSWAANGFFLGTSVAFSAFYIATYDYIKLENAKNSSRKTISILASKQLEQSSMSEGLTQIAMQLSEALHFSNWSVYIDSYLLGSSSASGREMRRLTSSSGNENLDNLVVGIDADSGNGQLMREAIDSRRPLFRNFSEANAGACLILPIGKSGCINISTKKRMKFDEQFINAFINESYPQIDAISQTQIKFESTATLSTNLLKEDLGVGTHKIEFGAIFADAVGYTQNVNATKTFIEFFEREYIPNLLRNLDKKVVLKDLFGDELYLVVLPKEMSAKDDKSIYETTVEMVRIICEFSLGLGSELCQTAGYKPIEFRIGANAGMGQIVVSHSNVALSGPVIEAKRCQGRAHASEPFITDVLMNCSSESIRARSIKETYAAKKEILNGYRILLKSKAA